MKTLGNTVPSQPLHLPTTTWQDLALDAVLSGLLGAALPAGGGAPSAAVHCPADHMPVDATGPAGAEVVMDGLVEPTPAESACEAAAGVPVPTAIRSLALRRVVHDPVAGRLLVHAVEVAGREPGASPGCVVTATTPSGLSFTKGMPVPITTLQLSPDLIGELVEGLGKGAVHGDQSMLRQRKPILCSLSMQFKPRTQCPFDASSVTPTAGARVPVFHGGRPGRPAV